MDYVGKEETLTDSDFNSEFTVFYRLWKNPVFSLNENGQGIMFTY